VQIHKLYPCLKQALQHREGCTHLHISEQWPSMDAALKEHTENFHHSRVSGSVLLCYASDCTYQNELVTAAHIRIHAQTFQIAEKEILVHLQAHSTKQLLITNLNSIKDILKDPRPKLHRKWLHTLQKLVLHTNQNLPVYQENSSHFQTRHFCFNSDSSPYPKKKAIIPNLCICHHDFFFTTRNSFRMKIRLCTASQGEINRALHY